MANTAAHLVDRVLPAVPVRQWVLSLPFELRRLAAFRADVLTALVRIFVEAIERRYKAWARREGFGDAPIGAVTHVQRFGSSVNLNVHFHVMVLDGVFTRAADGAPLFHPAPTPTRDELESAVRRVRQRVENLHASVAIAADDDVGRERLMRYGARPPIALERLRLLPGGRVAYRIKALRDGRAKHRVMTPLEFLARLAALVPPPRYPLVRYHGVLAPRSSWRSSIVPRTPTGGTRDVRKERPTTPPSQPERPTPAGNGRLSDSCSKAPPPSVSRESPGGRSERSPGPPPATAPLTSVEAAPLASAIAAPGTPGAVLLAPNVLSVKHWDRVLQGALYATASRVDWPTLLRRTFDVDVLVCPECRGRLRILGQVTDEETVGRVLAKLGMPTQAPRAARARDPTDLLGDVVAEP